MGEQAQCNNPRLPHTDMPAWERLTQAGCRRELSSVRGVLPADDDFRALTSSSNNLHQMALDKRLHRSCSLCSCRTGSCRPFPGSFARENLRILQLRSPVLCVTSVRSNCLLHCLRCCRRYTVIMNFPIARAAFFLRHSPWSTA